MMQIELSSADMAVLVGALTSHKDCLRKENVGGIYELALDGIDILLDKCDVALKKELGIED